MGHVRLSRLPRSRKWVEVVNLLSSKNFSVQQLAEASANAANETLRKASSDIVLNEVFKLLCLLPRAAKEANFQDALSKLGIIVKNDPTLTDIAQAFANRINAFIKEKGLPRSDLGEMAKYSAIATILGKVEENSVQLWEATPDDIKHGLSKLAATDKFGDMSQGFFTDLTKKVLQYYLDRELPKHIGQDKAFYAIVDMRAFDLALEHHCKESSFIMRAFAQCWYGKTYAKKAVIDKKKVAGFVYVASNKIANEFTLRVKNA